MIYTLAVLTWILYTLFVIYFCYDSYKKSFFGRFFFLFFSFYYLSIRPFFIFTGLDLPIPANQFKGDYWGDMLSVNLLISFWVFLIVSLSGIIVKRRNVGEFSQYRFGYINKNYLSFLTVFLTLVGLLISVMYILKFGGVGAFLYNVKAKKAMAGLYVFREINTWALFLAGALFLFSVNYKKRKLKYFSLVLIIVNSGIIFSWGNRTVIGFFIVLLLTIYYTKLSKIDTKKIAIILTILMSMGIGLKVARDTINSNVTGYEYNYTDAMSPYTTISLAMHWSEYDGLLLAVRDVGVKFEYRSGEDFLNGLTAWVPRFIWEEKPDSHKVGRWFRQVYQPDKANGWPITALGNLYVNGGLLFVVMGVVLTAILVSIVDNLSSVSLMRDYLLLIFCIFVLHQGLDNDFVQKFILTFVPIYVFYSCCRLVVRQH